MLHRRLATTGLSQSSTLILALSKTLLVMLITFLSSFFNTDFRECCNARKADCNKKYVHESQITIQKEQENGNNRRYSYCRQNSAPMLTVISFN